MFNIIIFIIIMWIIPFVGNWLAHICEEELKPGKKWFILTIHWLLALNISILGANIIQWNLPNTTGHILLGTTLLVVFVLAINKNVKNFHYNTKSTILLIINALSLEIMMQYNPLTAIFLATSSILTLFLLSALRYEKKILKIQTTTIKQLIYFSIIIVIISLLLFSFRNLI